MNDDDLRLEHQRAKAMAELCERHGEVDPAAHYRAIVRACEAEAKAIRKAQPGDVLPVVPPKVARLHRRWQVKPARHGARPPGK